MKNQMVAFVFFKIKLADLILLDNFMDERHTYIRSLEDQTGAQLASRNINDNYQHTETTSISGPICKYSTHSGIGATARSGIGNKMCPEYLDAFSPKFAGWWVHNCS